jgi:lipoate-protein ligase A
MQGSMFGSLIVDAPCDGAWNMALDEALLEGAIERREASVRFYQWAMPTLSLGYFQAARDRTLHEASQGCAMVRRSTGGGAILHDRELTYSIVLPAGHALAKRPPGLYDLAHDTLVSLLREWGLAADRVSEAALEESFLCFARRSQGDVVLAGYKVAGSAQRRRKGAVLQHGSILLSRSPAAPELPGIAELGRVVSVEGLLAEWQPRLCAGLGTDWKLTSPSEVVVNRAQALVRGKFGTPHWNERK